MANTVEDGKRKFGLLGNLRVAMNRRDAICEVIESDYDAARLGQGQENQGYKRRTEIRTFFAAVEAKTFAEKQLALRWYELMQEYGPPMPPPHLSDKDLATLKGVHHLKKKKGTAEPLPIQMRMLANLKFTCRTCANLWDSVSEVVFEGEEWKAFKRAVGIRNDLTHPSSVEALHVDDGKFAKFQRAVTWYQENISRFFADVIRARNKFTVALRDDKPLDYTTSNT